MRNFNFIAFAAALAINFALIAAFQNSADEALPVPKGEVTVTEIGFDSVPTLARVVDTDAERAAL